MTMTLTLLGLLCAGGPSEDRPSAETYAEFARSHAGDANRGRSLFADPGRLACARCHRVRGQGGDVGPDLSDIGGKFDRELLIESILEPSRQIVEGYRPTLLALKDGRVLTGIVREETTETLALVDAEAHRQSIPKAEVEERRVVATSLMPEAQASGLTPAEFADLIAYLACLRSEGQGTPGSGVVGPVALPGGFVRSQVASGLTGATAMEIAPDGRIFICEQTGTLRVVKNAKLLPAPFLRVEVDSQWERGLIGVALDPDFPRNGFLYVCYVSATPHVQHRISRFTARGDVAVPDSERILFEGDDQAALGGVVPSGHQGGAIHFGPDGKLYIALGEQTAREPAQRLDTLLGKLLRIDRDGTIPEDNPFFKTATGKYRTIWALGLRNPFTFAVQPETGRIFVNDVGDTRWEEINEAVAGGNYGWPVVEGPSMDDRFRAPIYAYPVASIAGGAFCPASGPSATFPAPYRSRYFFADFVKGWIKTLDPDHPGRVETFATGLARPVDLKFAPDGSLYVLLRDAWVKDDHFRPGTGSLHRIAPSSLIGP
jgi:putative heme-binding domain-containing protein